MLFTPLSLTVIINFINFCITNLPTIIPCPPHYKIIDKINWNRNNNYYWTNQWSYSIIFFLINR